jgi:glycosyltransferase involved in cell wall biosynthesis
MAGRGKRVLFVLEYYPPHVGGVETLFGQLAESLAAAGYEVSVVTSRLPGTPARELRGGVNVVRVAVPRWGTRYWFSVLAVPTVLRLARHADVIHTTTYNAAIPAWVAAKLYGVPAVITVHEVFADQWHRLPGVNPVVGFGYRLFEWAVLSLPFARYVGDSEFTRRRLVAKMRVKPADTAVAYPPVHYDFWDAARHTPRDVKRELGMRESDGLYLYFGRPGVSKGIEYLLRAAVRVSRVAPGSRLLMLLSRSPAGQHRRIVGLIRELGLTNHVTVKDPVPRLELPGYLRGADCVVVPSVSEGFGYAAVESASLGCRVIATAGHSVEEVVGGSVHLVPACDPDALAAAILDGITGRLPVRPPAPRVYTLDAHRKAVEAVYAAIGSAPASVEG